MALEELQAPPRPFPPASGGAGHWGCAVGALVCEVRDVQAVKAAVTAAGWRKCPGNVVDVDDNHLSQSPPTFPGRKRKAVHLSTFGAAAVEATAHVPDAISELLRSGRALWIPGLRQCTPRHERRTTRAPHAWFTFAELFAGIGGFRCALEPLGGDCVFASEMDTVPRKVYAANHGGDVPAGDITGVPDEDLPICDILTAGFPCQPYSICGTQTGLLDSRGQLFFEVIRATRLGRPKALLLENVANLAETNGGADLRAIVQALRDAGYVVHHRVISSASVVPQRRNRVYFVAFRADLAAASRNFAWPDILVREPASRLQVLDILEPEPEVATSFALSSDKWQAISRKFATASSGVPDALAARCVDVSGSAQTLMSSYRRSEMLYSQFVPPPSILRVAQRHQAAVRGEQLGHAATGAATAAQHASERQSPRYFTERECCRLQGFDDSFLISDFGQKHRFYHCIGNAVCPPVISHITKAMLTALLCKADDCAGGIPELFPMLRGAPTPLSAHVSAPVPYPTTWRLPGVPATDDCARGTVEQ